MNQTVFTAFYQKNVQRVFRYVLFRVAGNHEVAEDLTQDIFLKAYNAFASYDEQRSKSSWIFTIAKHVVIDWYKKQHPTEDIENHEDSLAFSVDAAKLYITNEENQILLEGMAKLPSEDAELMQMRFLEGWDYKGLAEIFQKNEMALRARVSRALKKLKLHIHL